MKVLYTRLLPSMAVAATISALSFSAFAQPAPAAGPTANPPVAQERAHRPDGPQRQAQHAERMQKRMAEHQNRLKASLQLSPQQEPAWNAFVARMQPPAQRPAQARMDREAWNQLSTPQRLDRMDAMKAERDRAIAQRHEAIRSFYAQLNPAQQKAFDAQQLAGPMRTGMKGPGKRHGDRGAHRQHHAPGQPRL